MYIHIYIYVYWYISVHVYTYIYLCIHVNFWRYLVQNSHQITFFSRKSCVCPVHSCFSNVVFSQVLFPQREWTLNIQYYLNWKGYINRRGKSYLIEHTHLFNRDPWEFERVVSKSRPIYMYKSEYVFMYVHVYVYVYLSIYKYIYMCTCIYIYVYTRTYIYIYIYIYMHVQIR